MAKFCANCGSPLDGAGKFCPSCGAQVMDAPQAQEKPEEKPRQAPQEMNNPPAPRAAQGQPQPAMRQNAPGQNPGQGGTKRAEEDAYAKFKYDTTAAQDNVIIARVAELAEKRGVTMTEVSLAWLLTRVTSPVVGATKLSHIEGAVKAVELELTEEELACLEEPYVPHPLAGVMAQNKPAAAKEKHVWSTGDQKIGR